VKLLGLHLLAYGPFTNVQLDLLPEGVHIVYGKNEAGKSTALRAITGLLYGIAPKTPDAHVHKMPDLRVGGNFRIPDGGSVYLVRRKGKENTLLDRDGRLYIFEIKVWEARQENMLQVLQYGQLNGKLLPMLFDLSFARYQLHSFFFPLKLRAMRTPLDQQ